MAELEPMRGVSEEFMKILRSVTQRGFNVGPAGYFTVLRTNAWFAASRIPSGFQYPSGRFKGVGQMGTQNPALPSLSVDLAQHQRQRLRPILIVSAAIAITLLMLAWIMAGAPTNIY
jgi:hypothetical protein